MFHIYVRSSFVILHAWKDAPDLVAFLRYPHRHKFSVKLTVAVDHDNRDVEFFILQQILNEAIEEEFKVTQPRLPLPLCGYSCEQMALMLVKRIQAEQDIKIISCEVSEDEENGAIYYV